MLGPFDQPKTPEVKKVLNDKKVSDHHAIIPTVELAEFDFSKLREWEQKILFLIAVHTVEAMEEDHVFMETEVEVRCQDEIFKAKGKVVKQIGWKLFEECFKNEDGLAIENPADAGKDRIPKVEADHNFTTYPQRRRNILQHHQNRIVRIPCLQLWRPLEIKNLRKIPRRKGWALRQQEQGS